jgi:hypothetical protein
MMSKCARMHGEHGDGLRKVLSLGGCGQDGLIGGGFYIEEGGSWI